MIKNSLPLVFKGFSASVRVGLLSISSGAQYVTVQTYFSHPSLVIHFFATPPINLKPGQQTGTSY